MSNSSPAVFTPLTVAGALIAGLVGSIVWASIRYFAGMEHSYVGWGIVGLVGFATIALGGRGMPVAIGAAAVTVLSIFGGKALTFELEVQEALETVADASVMRPAYEASVEDAEAWADVDAGVDREVRAFMIERGYLEGDPRRIPKEDVREFLATTAPYLTRMHDEEPDFATWHRERQADARETIASLSMVGAIVDDLDPRDFVFAVLAIVTALGMVVGAGDAPRPIAGSFRDRNDDEQRRAA